MLCAPLRDLLPLQHPDAVHDAAFVELHDNREALPAATAVGVAASAAVGTTLTATLAALLPPGPVHVNE